MCCLKEIHFKYEGRSPKSKRIEKKIHSVNTSRKKISVCINTAQRKLQTGDIPGGEGGHCTAVQESVH